MAFLTPTAVTVGESTKKSWTDVVKDDLVYLYGQLGNTAGDKPFIPNGSFEVDSDSDGIPDGWTVVLQSGGAGVMDNYANYNSGSGTKSFKFTSPGSGGGGGYIMSGLVEVNDNKTYKVSFLIRSSANGLANKVVMDAYSDATLNYSTTTWTENSVTDANFHLQEFYFTPAGAKFVKFKFYGADSASAVAGSTWFDNCSIQELSSTKTVEFEGSGTTTKTYKYVAPIDGVHSFYWVRVTCFGGGGGGSAHNASGNQGGGGGGQMAQSILKILPTTVYQIDVGGGGVGVGGGGGLNGLPGGDSKFGPNGGAVLVTAKGGSGGINGSGGGAGGTGGTGQRLINGYDGRDPIGGVSGGHGGESIWGKCGGDGGVASAGGSPNGSSRGAGGGGAGGSFNGGNGGYGSVIIEYLI